MGNPVRQSLLNVNKDESRLTWGLLQPGDRLLGVLGGSGGSKAINEAMLQALEALLGIRGECPTA